MIKIKNIEIKDFGRHRHLKHSCEGCVVGLAGPNGRGKSTVLQALQYALTGTIDHPDPIPAFIRRADGDASPKSAAVTVEFEADGKRGSITRKVTRTTSSRELRWEGLDAPVTAEKRVAEVLLDILGVDRRAINSTVFIRQGEMTSMFGKDTERRDFYMRLLMLGGMEKIADVVENYRKHIAESLQDLSAVRDEAESSYAGAAERFSETDARLRAAVDPSADLAAVRQVGKALDELGAAEDAKADARRQLAVATAAAVSHEETRAKIAEISGEINRLMDMQQQHSAALVRLRQAESRHADLATTLALYADLDTKAEAVTSNPPATGDDPSKELAALHQVVGKLARRDTLVAELEKADAARQTSKTAFEEKRTRHADLGSEKQTLLESLNPLRADLDLRKRLQRELGGCADAACPACGSSSPDHAYLARSIAALEAQIDPLLKRLVEIDTALQAAEIALRSATTDHTTHENQFQALASEDKRLRAELLMVGPAEDVRRRITEVESAYAAWVSAARRHADAVTAHRQAEARVSGKARPSQNEWQAAEEEKRLASEQQIDLPAGLPEQIARKRSDLNTLSGSLRTLENCQAVLQQAEQRVKAAEATLATLTTAMAAETPLLHARLLVEGTVTLLDVMRITEELTQQQQAYNALCGECKAAKDAMTAANARLTEIDLRMAEQAHRRALAADLASVRDTFKPNGAPIEYLDYKFGQIAKLAADYLAESQADFMVAASADAPLSFDFLRLDRPGEVWMPQNRLSGGQKVRLAVATLRAIHALVMPNVGLLVLDEPTTHLDDEAKKSMADMLRKIGDEGTLQMVVCDHSPELLDAFIDVITLPD